MELLVACFVLQGLTSFSLVQGKAHLAGSRWNTLGSIMAALEPFMVSYSEDNITLWNRKDARRVLDVSVGSGVIGVVASMKKIQKGGVHCREWGWGVSQWFHRCHGNQFVGVLPCRFFCLFLPQLPQLLLPAGVLQ